MPTCTLKCETMVGMTDTDLGPVPAGHSSAVIRVNDAGDEAELILNGIIVDTYAGTLPTEQMQPYIMVLIRDSTTSEKNLHVHDFQDDYG